MSDHTDGKTETPHFLLFIFLPQTVFASWKARVTVDATYFSQQNLSLVVFWGVSVRLFLFSHYLVVKNFIKKKKEKIKIHQSAF